MSELNNPLLAGGFEGTVDLGAMQGIMDPSFTDQNGDGIPDHYNQELAPLHTNHRGYIGEDGNVYRKEISVDPETGEASREYTDERLYFWNPPQELGDRGLNGDAEAASAGRDKFGAAGLYTEAEIREAWDAKEGMGYLKEANPNLTWDSYWNFVQRTTELFTDTEYNDMTDGNMSADNFQDSPEYMALLEESGIATQYVNDDGDVFNWNGTSYSKDFKVDDSIDIGMINTMALGLIGGFVAGPLLATALGPTLGVAGAKAASAAITSMASQYMTTGEMDIKDALIAAATAYGGAKLGDMVKGAGIFGEVGEKMSEVSGKFNDLITTGNSIADAAIKAGGMSLLTQFVTTGEIDPMQAGIAALMAGGTQAFSEWTASMYDAGEVVSDGLLEEITVEAKRVGNDLGNGMYELDGVVFSEEGGYIGNMSELDLNGDGALSGDDLQNITTPDRELVDPNLDNENIYGDVDLAPPTNTETPDAFTNEWADERYAGMSEKQIRIQMERDGFDDDTINGYIESTAVDAGFNPNIVEHPGGWVENMEQPYTLETRNGEYYIIKDGKLKAISAAQYEELGYYLVDGDAVGAGDYMDQQGITDGGNIFGGYDEFGRPTPGSVEGVEDWLDLNDPNAGSDAVQVELTDDTTEDTPDTSTDSDDSAPTGDPNKDTDSAGTGSGGGDTDSTGGTATPGVIGGGGAPGGGSTAGGAGGDINDLPPLFLPPLSPPVTPGTSGGPGGEVVDSTGDGNVTGDGVTDGGTTGGTSGGDNDGDATDGDGDNDGTGDGTSDGDSLGDGTGGGTTGNGGGTSGTGDETGDGTGEGGGAGGGGGTGGGTGGGAGGNTGGGTGTTTGPTYGTSPGPGGTGTGAGGGGNGGLMSGGSGSGGDDYNPSWGELFAYSVPKGYEKKAVARQYKDYIQEAKGLLS